MYIDVRFVLVVSVRMIFNSLAYNTHMLAYMLASGPKVAILHARACLCAWLSVTAYGVCIHMLWFTLIQKHDWVNWLIYNSERLAVHALCYGTRVCFSGVYSAESDRCHTSNWKYCFV